MVKRIVQNRIASNQAYFSTEGNMSKRIFNHFVDDLIREYGEWNSNTYVLNAHSLPDDILRLFLPHILEPSDLDDLELNPSLGNSYVKDNLNYIQKCIDERSTEVFREDMEEMGRCLRHDSINGEIIYPRY